MEYPDPARVARLMTTLEQPVLPLERLADLLARPEAEAALARTLRTDRRFRVISTGTSLPGADAWPPAVRAAYDDAFRQAGLGPTRYVILVEPPESDAGDQDSLPGLLRGTLSRLLASGPSGADAAAAAAPMAAALAGIIPSAGAPSTTRLPPAPAPQ